MQFNSQDLSTTTAVAYCPSRCEGQCIPRSCRRSHRPIIARTSSFLEEALPLVSEWIPLRCPSLRPCLRRADSGPFLVVLPRFATSRRVGVALRGDLDTRGVKLFRLGQMGDSLYYFQDRPDRWGVSPTLQLYFACILPRHSQTPRTINRILTQCLSSLRTHPADAIARARPTPLLA